MKLTYRAFEVCIGFMFGMALGFACAAYMTGVT